MQGQRELRKLLAFVLFNTSNKNPCFIFSSEIEGTPVKFLGLLACSKTMGFRAERRKF